MGKWNQALQTCSGDDPQQKNIVDGYVVGQGAVHCGGTVHYGGYLGLLASIGVPVAIDLISTFGKGLQVKLRPPQHLSLLPPRSGKGMHVNPPPPFSGNWDDYKKKFKLKELVQILQHPPWRVIFAQWRKTSSSFSMYNQHGFFFYYWQYKIHLQIKEILQQERCSTASYYCLLINMDDFGSLGTHWVCCWCIKNGDHEYLDSFGLPRQMSRNWNQKSLGRRAFFMMRTSYSGLGV